MSEKAKGSLRIVFLSRIGPVKNLLFALQILPSLVGDVVFDIYGPIDQKSYWAACEKTIVSLPAQVKVNYKGPVHYSDVAATLSRYHFLLLPTTGENFGHVIVEALSVGCPVIISDCTRWRNLQARAAGWDLPLSDRSHWSAVLQHCIEMGDAEYRSLSEGAQRVAKEQDSSHAIASTLQLFEAAIARNVVTEAMGTPVRSE
jgi:glycosyltransferase involved in cell wall biosynthesis